VTAEEVQREAHYCDMLLDAERHHHRSEVELRRRDALLDAARPSGRGDASTSRTREPGRGLDVPEVEDFPLAMEEETETFTQLKATLCFRSVRAFERWSGKSVTPSGHHLSHPGRGSRCAIVPARDDVAPACLPPGRWKDLARCLNGR